MAFDQTTRNRLQRFVTDARTILSDEFTRQLQNEYGLNPETGEVSELSKLTFLDDARRKTAKVLRETLAHYLAATPNADKVEILSRIVREQAFTILNRMAALRMAEARGILMESIGNGYQSKGFQLYSYMAGSALGESGESYRTYIFSLFDEFSLDLKVLFDRFSHQGRLFPKDSTLLELLDLINHPEVELLWVEDETIGWIYQYFNSKEERKKMRDASKAPRNSRELAVRNQFFTPRYVVEFLTDNTLGRIWYEMTQGKTSLTESCRYLVRRPNEIFLKRDENAPKVQSDKEDLSQEELLKEPVYIPYRPLKDPRDLKMLDPACGSMHFGLYAFDLFEKIYDEAWDLEASIGPKKLERSHKFIPLNESYDSKDSFLQDVPRLIIENNIHGVDIDPRATQIAGLSLWLRAQKSWQEMGINTDKRPQVQKSNIVCAEPMPGEKDLLEEFTSNLKPRVIGQLVEIIFDKMQLAGEAGSLLKIEEEIKDAIKAARTEYNEEILLKKEHENYLPGMAPARQPTLFDFADLPDDEAFWDQAEHKILDALSEYAEHAEGGTFEQKRLFTQDAAKGFAFIDLCRKQFDVVVMNPPFGEASCLSESYLKKYYLNFNKNVLCAFISRANNWGDSEVHVGVIYDKTSLIKSTYEGFRREHLLPDSRMVSHIDLGWGVLDANVEVACSVLNPKVQKIRRYGIFIDVRQIKNDDKYLQIVNDIDSLIDLDFKKKPTLIDPYTFQRYPNAVLGHDFPLFVRLAFSTLDRFSDYTTLFEGHTLKSEIFFRYWWEVPENEPISYESKWKRIYNGGAYQKFISPISEVGCLGKQFQLVSKQTSTVLRNKSLQGKGVVGFGKRGEFLDAHIVPVGFISTVEGKHVIVKKGISPYVILALLNSKIFQFIINLYCGQHKYPGYVGIFPVPNLLYSQEIIHAGKVCEEITNKIDRIYAFNETYPMFGNISNFCITEKLSKDIDNKKSEIQNLEEQLNEFIYEAYNLKEEDKRVIESYCTNEPTQKHWWLNSDLSLPKKYFSFLFGVYFGRWKTVEQKKEFITTLNPEIELPTHPSLLNSITKRNESNSNQILELNNQSEKRISEFLEHEILDNDDFYDLQEMIDSFGTPGDTLSEILTDHKCFFDFHLSDYSLGSRQAPIYWLLQTPSASYSLWIYYHSLTDQTLYTCVNNFVDLKLKTVIDDLNNLRNISNRSTQEEKKLEQLINFELELTDFRDELLRITKFWKPNLNDGVQITAAPLWKLFQHKPWQKKLKQTWEKLEKGDYDWAHLAYSIWPERVKEKCKKDKSLAIAHDLEELYEES